MKPVTWSTLFHVKGGSHNTPKLINVSTAWPCFTYAITAATDHWHLTTLTGKERRGSTPTYPMSRSLSTLTSETTSGQEGKVDDNDLGMMGRKLLKLFFFAICVVSAGTGVGMVGAGKMRRNRGFPDVDLPRARARPNKTGIVPRHRDTEIGQSFINCFCFHC